MATQKAPRDRSIVRLFLNESSAEPAGRAGLDCTAVVFKFPDDSELRVDLADFFGGELPPPCVGRAAAAFGLNTSIGNAGNTVKSEAIDPDTGKPAKASPEEVREAMEARVETLQEGKWASDMVGGGARPSMLLAAVKEYREKNHKPVDDATMARIRQQLRDDEEKAKTWSKLPAIVTILNRMRAEREQASAHGNEREAGLLD